MELQPESPVAVFPLLPRQDWRQAVYDNHTTLPIHFGSL